jgi:hypothetical protein
MASQYTNTISKLITAGANYLFTLIKEKDSKICLSKMDTRLQENSNTVYHKKSKQSLIALFSSLATGTDETAYYPKRGYDMNTIEFLTKADNIEHLLCLTVLIASEKFLPTATLSEANEYYDNLGPQGCEKCLLVNRCMATIINQ